MTQRTWLFATLFGACFIATACGETPVTPAPTVSDPIQIEKDNCVKKRMADTPKSAAHHELISTGHEIFLTCTHSRDEFQKGMSL